MLQFVSMIQNDGAHIIAVLFEMKKLFANKLSQKNSGAQTVELS